MEERKYSAIKCLYKYLKFSSKVVIFKFLKFLEDDSSSVREVKKIHNRFH